MIRGPDTSFDHGPVRDFVSKGAGRIYRLGLGVECARAGELVGITACRPGHRWATAGVAKEPRSHQEGVFRGDILGDDRVTTQNHAQDRRDTRRDNQARNYLPHGHDLLPCKAALLGNYPGKQPHRLASSGRPDEAVLHAIFVNVVPDDHPRWVNANDKGTLHRLRIVHRVDSAVGSAQEAYRHVGTRDASANGVLNVTRDRSRRIDGRGTAKGPKLRGGKVAEGTVASSKEDAKFRVLRGVNVESGDNPAVVDGSRRSAHEEAGGGVRSVECSEVAVDGAQEAMNRAVRVEVTAQNQPC